jgi:serine/threonine-protein kinase
MLTGTFPKDFVRGKDVIATALNDPAVPIRNRNASIPKKLAELIDHALIEKPDIGIQTAAEFRKQLEAAL